VQRVAFALFVFAGLAGFTACNKSSPAAPTSTVQAGVVSVSATSLSFSTQAVGSASAGQIVTLGNGLTSPVTVSNIAASGDFAETTTCAGTLAAGASCTITVGFTPTSIGTRSGILTIADSDATSPSIVALTGIGGAAEALLAPTNMTFPGLPVGQAGKQNFTFTNGGGAVINVSSVTISGDADFSETTNCGALQPGSACTVTVTFTPGGTGARSAKVTIFDDSPGNPHVGWVTGSAVAVGPLVSFAQTVLTFGPQTVGTTSSPLTAQFINLGLSGLNVSSISASGDFAQTNACALPVPAQGICTIKVTFAPTAPGTRIGALTVTDNAGTGVQTVVLSGTATTGSTGGPLFSVAPVSLNFGNQPIATPSAPQSVTVTNGGTAPLAITGVTTTNEFSLTNGCGPAIAAGGSCRIDVRFTPGAPDVRTGALTISDNAPGSPHSLALMGVGTGTLVTGPSLSVNPRSLSFGFMGLGTSATQNVSISNVGVGDLTITGIGTEGDFSEADACRGRLAAGSACSIAVTFAPKAIGTRTGRLTVTTDTGSSPQVVALDGSGGVGQVTLAPGNLIFSLQTVATTSTSQQVTVTNSGDLAISIASLAATGDFAETDTCVGATLQGAGTCTVTVTFTPTATGTRAGLITIVDTAPGSPHTVVLTGTGG
jgi:hypothetical protein